MTAELTPKEIGGFRILRRLASGASSDVLLARAEGPHGFQRVVALKILLARPKDNPDFERSFAADASSYARLAHPAVVKLYDFFSADGQLVLVLEYVDGLPLHKLRAMLATTGERIDDTAALFLGLRVFSALAAAHSARDAARGVVSPVIHYDVNPSNILVPWDGQVKLGDFGIARAAGIQADARAGFIKGTYGYSAPEQVSGKDVTLRADVYSAALILWELLARRKAVQRGSLNDAQVLKAMAHPEFPALELLRPDLQAEVRGAIKRALEPEADRRLISAEEMVNVLRQAVNVEDGRKSLAAALTRVKGLAGDTSGPAAAAPAPARDQEARADLDDDARLDPEQTAPFAAVTDEPGDLGKIAFYGRIMLPADSTAPPRPGPSGPPLALSSPPDAAPPKPEGSPGPASPFGAPVRAVPRPAIEKKPSNFPATPPTPMPELGPATAAGPAVSAEPVSPLAASPAAPPGGSAEHVRSAESSSTASAPPVVEPIADVAPPAPPSEPVAGASPRTERSPEASPEASEAAERPRSSPPVAARPNAPPYVPSSLPPAPPKSSAPKLIATALVTAAAAAGLMFYFYTPGEAPTGPSGASATATASAIPAAPATAVASAREPETAPRPAPATSASAGPVAAVSSAATASSATSASPSASVRAAPVASAQPATSAVASAGAQPPSPVPDGPEPADTGKVELPASAAGHRIFVDGKVAGEGVAPLHVHCGSHLVRIGSAGTDKKVEVPCGGSLTFVP